jgi:hypothetical protein
MLRIEVETLLEAMWSVYFIHKLATVAFLILLSYVTIRICLQGTFS